MPVPTTAPLAGQRARTRFTLKVQDGCAGRCSYCAVRLARGAPWSLAAGAAVAQARAALDAGCGEIVLSGIDVGAYRDRRSRRRSSAAVASRSRSGWSSCPA